MLKGTLDDFTLPDIFRLMSLARKTGKLDVSRSAGRGTVFFREGDVYYAESSVAREPLGQKLIKAGHLGENQLMKALDEHAASGVRVGEVLVSMGAVTEEQLQRAVQEQIEDAVFDLLRWDLGEFAWESGVIADVEVPIQVSGENLIMEASRKLDELEVILRKIPSEHSVLAMASTPPEGAVEIRFTPEEWRLLVLVDGNRAVHDIAEIIGLDDLGAMKAFYGLVSAGLVEVLQSAEDEEILEVAEPEAAAEPEEAAEPETAPEPTVAATSAAEPEVAAESPDIAEVPAAAFDDVPEEVLAEPDPAALAEAEPVDVLDFDALTDLTEEAPAQAASPAADLEPETAEPTFAEAAPEAPDFETPGFEPPGFESEPVAAADGSSEESSWDAFSPEAFDAPEPEELSTQTPNDDFLNDLLGDTTAAPPAPDAPVAGPPPAAPPAPEPPPQPETIQAEAADPQPEVMPEAPAPAAPEVPAPAAEAPAEAAPAVDRAAVVRELAGLFDDDVEDAQRQVRRPAARNKDGEPGDGDTDDRKRVEDDDQVTRGLISRLIDGVKGL